MSSGPRIEALDESQLQERREHLANFLVDELPLPIPHGAVGFALDYYAGHFEALVHPAADPEIIRYILMEGIGTSAPTTDWRRLPDPFLLVAFGEGRGGTFWLMHRQGERFFYFRDSYFHTYAPEDTFESCHRALTSAWQTWCATAPRPGDYWHHMRDRAGTLRPPKTR